MKHDWKKSGKRFFASFARMEAFAETIGLKRLSKIHREIYLSDARKTSPEKLKTILRFKIE
jgi:hypothetical protein